MTESYVSVLYQSKGVYKDRGSKFLAFVSPISTESDAQKIINDIRSAHPKANHVCYAYVLGESGDTIRVNDDGEPSSTAGKPILIGLQNHGLTFVICAVVRYFGGIQLGKGGLSRAYRSATQEALNEATTKEHKITRTINIKYPIEEMGRLYDLLKMRNYKVIHNQYSPVAQMIVQVPIRDLTTVKAKIIADFLGYSEHDITENTQCPLEIEIQE